MPLENAVSITTLDANNPLGSDPIASADDHIRLIKSVLKTVFPTLNAPITVSPADLNTRGVPSGLIAMWSGLVANIPSGWTLCNGLNGTPDLRDRFIVGAGNSYAVGAQGGSVTAVTTVAGAHSHTSSVAGEHTPTGIAKEHVLTIEEMPSHQHGTSWGEAYLENAKYGTRGSPNQKGAGDSDTDNYEYLTEKVGGGKGHTHDVEFQPVAGHSHTTDSQGNHTHTVDTRSPYLALCFIMKV